MGLNRLVYCNDFQTDKYCLEIFTPKYTINSKRIDFVMLSKVLVQCPCRLIAK